MITEDYVSFEVARLLKEKGFLKGVDLRLIPNLAFYDNIGLQYNVAKWYDSLIQDKIDFVVAPTHQMVNKWIRKTYNIYIDVILLDKEDGDYGYVIQNIITRKYINTSNNNSYKVPEKAFEEALKYLFENVI